ncbi:hypothetical protein R6Q59_032309 [Mikania micrantha]
MCWLVRFYPLAGRLRFITGSGVFYEATSSAKIEDLKDFALPNELQSLVPLVDYGVSDLHELPLVMVQFNQLSCGGISLGIGISNILADGASASHFTEEWARIAPDLKLWQEATFGDVGVRHGDTSQPTKLNIAVSFRDRRSLPK